MLSISFRVTSLAQGQSYDCPCANGVSLKDICECMTLIAMNWWYHHINGKKGKLWCINYGIYCMMSGCILGRDLWMFSVGTVWRKIWQRTYSCLPRPWNRSWIVPPMMESWCGKSCCIAYWPLEVESTSHHWISFTKGCYSPALMFLSLSTWISCWINSRVASDFRHHDTHVTLL